MTMNMLLEAVISGALQFDAVIRCRKCKEDLYPIPVETVVIPGSDPAVVDAETKKATEILLAHSCVVKMARDAVGKVTRGDA